jgi:hypothetical protein
LLAVLLVLASGSAGAQEPATRGASEWEVTFSPYIWGTALEGEIDARGNSVDFDVEFSDILDMINVAAMAVTEARRGRFIGILDLFYADLHDDSNVGPLGGTLDAYATEVIADARLGYTLYEGHVDLQWGPILGDFAFDLLPGVRYWFLRTEVEVQTPLLGERSIDQKTDWIDPVIGGRLRMPLSERFALVLAGDYGGFGWGSCSDPTWEFLGMLRYQAGERWSLGVGWAALEVDRDVGNGSIDAMMDGFLVGASYRF